MLTISLVNIDPINTLILKATDSNNSNQVVFSGTLGPRKSSAPFPVSPDNNTQFSIIVSGYVSGSTANTVGGPAVGHSADQVEVSFGATVWVSRPKG
jgi:hypothetical protein